MKNLTNLFYTTKVSREGCPIAYFEAPTITAKNAVIISDYSNKIAQNSFFEKDIEIDLDTNDLTYYIDKNGFMLTDRFNDDNDPFFYKHKLKFDVFSDADLKTVDIIILDINGEEVSQANWEYDCGNKTIYHKLDTNNENIYFVVYPRADADNNLIDQSHREMLDGAPVFTEASSADIISSGCVNPDSDAYIIEEQDGQPYYWQLTLPRSGKYLLKYTDKGILKLTIPEIKQSDPWYINVHNAVVLATQLEENVLLRYAVAEFDLQNFYPFPPIKMSSDELAKVINGNILQLDHENIYLTIKTPVDIKIYNSTDSLIKALTTDENKTNKKIQNVFWEINDVKTIDTANGRIQIKHSLNAGEYAKVTFYYKETEYQYTQINFNPLYNSSILDQKVAILVRPSVTGCNNTISHVLISQDNILLSSSDDEINDWIAAGSYTLDDLKTNWLYVPGEYMSNQNNYFMLGIVTVSTPFSYNELSIQDVRRRGGGIIDSLIEDALNICKPASQNWDIKHWDGPQLPLQGGAVLYLPSWIKQIYTEDQIRAKASKYATAGTYILIRYYDI